MNYFAHAIRFLDRPYFVAGTAVPDWLSVADRKVRVRAALIEPFLLNDGSPPAEVAAGAWQHLDDDRWFHQTRAFAEVTADLAVRFRQALAPDDSLRAGFLGHIVTELLIDAELIERHPGLIERYYEVVGRIEPLAVQQAVNAMSKQPTENLAPLMSRFIEERFLPDYLSDERLLHRLNQVLRRVKLPPLPAQATSVLSLSRPLIRDRLRELLPEEHFQFPFVPRP
ncbi:MAG TPA: hypothetical protein VK137_20995 [Planctomycetaceae bacterium]|nr:hypothetical protein [Planctomycetaceae bacterium]